VEKVLIVDDLPEYTDTMEAYLEDRFVVLKAGNFQEAKKILGENNVALAIIDIRLKEDDPSNKEGIELLKWCKERSPKAGVIVMSAYREFDYAVEALNAGADYFMRKPLNPDELIKIADKLTEETG
jgi:DNA-binding NtrC family response regulator